MQHNPSADRGESVPAATSLVVFVVVCSLIAFWLWP